MNQFLPTFLRDAERYLGELRGDLQRLGNAPVEPRQANRLVRQIFQTLHTLKGSAAIFELQTLSRMVHRLETVVGQLENGEIEFDAKVFETLDHGLNRIEDNLRLIAQGDLTDSETSENVNSKLTEKSAPATFRFAPTATRNVWQRELAARFDESQQKRLTAAKARGERIFVVEVAFDFAEFAGKSVELRRMLDEIGEIVATLPGENQIAARLALQFVVATDANEFELSKIARDFQGEIVFSDSTAAHSRFAELCEIVFLAGRQLAERTKKKVVFSSSGDELQISAKQSAALKIALLHLVRNALAHGIESTAERAHLAKPETAEVTLETVQNEREIRIAIRDDGRGIDLVKLREKAVARELDDEIASLAKNNRLLDIIFHPGFSTAETITEDAGRGIGLDAVATAIKNQGGTISVESEVNRGTVFTIVLPASQQ